MSDFCNSGLSPQQFLDEYWQKKPLLIRQAFVDFESPVSPEELAGLACERDIESRIIQQHGSDSQWQVTKGPLSEADFEQLPETHWTLLVQDVDKHLPELQTILDPFRFIADWRRDDIMISYAPEHGTVGPHTDSYDVFLLQAHGNRRWQVGASAISKSKLQQGLDVQILQQFDYAYQWDLAAGDMLYLPPHFAHHGVALDDCMTYSIGFRSPSTVDLLDSLVNSMLINQRGQTRYSDADMQVSQYSHQIDADAIERVKSLLHQAIDGSDKLIAQALGQYVSETKSTLQALAAETASDVMDVAQLHSVFEQGASLQRNLYHNLSWAEVDDELLLFAAGQSYQCSGQHSQAVIALTEYSEINYQQWLSLNSDSDMDSVLCQLIAEGVWFWDD